MLEFINIYSNDILLIVLLLVFVIIVLKLNRVVKLEKRISKYSINSIKKVKKTAFDNVYTFYLKLIKSFSKFLNKFILIRMYSNYYKKHSNVVYSAMDHISIKFISSYILLLISFIYFIINRDIYYFEFLCAAVIGFVFPDIIYRYKYNLRRRRIERDLLRAIIIMNNSFKSGSSIVQAIDNVIFELNGDISREFEKVKIEFEYGIDLSKIFSKLYDNLKIEDIKYVYSVLDLLNKVGGNIVKAFDRIESDLYNKRKLKLEYKVITYKTNALVKTVLLIPMLLMLLIFFLDNNYYISFFSTEIGMMVFAVAFSLYLIYVVVIRKIMRIVL